MPIPPLAMAWGLRHDKFFDATFGHCRGTLYMKQAEDRGKKLIGSVGEVGTTQRYKNMGYEKKFFFGGT